jgi:APA family basic amino acid/polyamine antiporter
VVARVGKRTGAPYVAALLVCTASLGFALTGDIGLVARVTDFSVYGIFIVVNLSLIALRFHAADHPRHFKVPLSIGRVPVLPIAGILTTVLMLLFLEPAAWIIGFIANALAVVTWVILRLWSGRPLLASR